MTKTTTIENVGMKYRMLSHILRTTFSSEGVPTDSVHFALLGSAVSGPWLQEWFFLPSSLLYPLDHFQTHLAPIC